MDESRLRLDASTAAELAAFDWLREVGSTQDEAFARPLPARGARVLGADRQTGGRGRRGRAWLAPPGGTLAFTVMRGFDLPPRALAPLGPVVGAVLAGALRGLGADVGVKWPNDLVSADRKLGGILIEARGAAVAIGIGLNLDLPDGLPIDQPWTDLRRAGVASPEPGAVLSALLCGLLPALARFEREGLGAFREAWSQVDVLAGRPVRVLAGEAVHEGRAMGLAEDGGLRVQEASGERIHHAGEVSVRVAA